LATEALTLSRKLFGDTSEQVALALEKLAGVEVERKEYQDAEAHNREDIAILEKLGGHEYELQIARANLANTLTQAGKWQEAEVPLYERLAFSRKVYGEDHPVTAIILENIGVNLMEQQDRLPEAEKVLRETVEIRRKRFGNEHPEVAKSLYNLAAGLVRQHKLTEATDLLREVVDLYRNHPEWSLNNQNFAYSALGKALADQGDLAQAEAVQSEHLALLRKRDPKNGWMPHALAELVITLMAQQKFAEAEPLAQECLASNEEISPDDRSAFSARILLGECLLNQKRFSDAEPLLIAGYEGIKQRSVVGFNRSFLYRRQPGEKKALELLVRLYEETGRPDRVAEWKQKLAEFEKSEANAKATAR